MSALLRAALLQLGYTEDHLETLVEYYTAVKALKKQKHIKTAVVSASPVDAYNRVRDTAYTLFGGFGPSQVRWLLRFADADTICTLMFRLRSESWSRGWVRTKAAVEALT